MENFLKKRGIVSKIFVSITIFGLVFVASPSQFVLAATTNSNNNAPTQIVSLNETNFLAMDFNINVGSDAKIAGTTIGAGTAITATKPAGWTSTKFYDASGGGQWNSGTDWIGIDLDSDGIYTSQADEMIYDGSWSYGSPLEVGTVLTAIEASDKVCTDSLTAPSCIYFTTSGNGCGEDGGDADGHDTSVIVGTGACDSDGDVLVTSASNWSFRDGASTVFDNDEDLFIERGGQGLTYSDSADTTTAGTNPVGGTSITATKPAGWSSMSFYDASGGGVYNASADWIGTDADSNDYYLDKITALTADLSEAATINALSDTINIKFWLDDGNGSFDSGSDTLLGTASTASAYDSGGSGWYVSGLSQALPAGTSRIFVSMTLNSNASNGETIKMTIPQYVDSDNDKTFDLGDRGTFLSSRVLGNVTNVNSQTVDAIPPTVEVAMDDYYLKVGDTATVTFTFSEPVTGFTNADLTIQNGELSSVSSDDDGTTYTATFTPTSAIEDLTNNITVNKTGIYDVPGNPGVGSTASSNYQIDTIRPVLTSATVSDTKLKIGDTASVTFTFSEAVDNFANADLTIPNATLTDVASEDSGVTWTATLTPDSSVEDLTNTITVAMTGVNDKKLSSDSNTGSSTSSSVNYEIDTIRPTLSSATFSDSKLKIGDTATVTFTFSETVSGFTGADLTVPNGSLTEPSSADSGLTWTATFTPSSTIEDLINVITVAMTGVDDKKLVTDSNAGSDTSDSSNYEIDTVRPTLSSAVFADDELEVGDTSLVTFTFSEAVSGFTNADLTIPNATLTTVSSDDGGTVWTATITPDSSIEDLSNEITVSMAGINDTRLSTDSNAGTGSPTSSNYAIDTIRPVLVAAVFDNDGLLIGSTSSVTFTFSEPVTHFTNVDVSVPNGALSTIESISSTVYTATFTPSSSVHDLTNTLTVDMTGVRDMFLPTDYNTGSDTSSSDNYQIDTIRPTLISAVFTDDSLTIGETSLVTFTFSEEVTGFDNDDLTVQRGTLTTVTSADGGLIWTGTFTPSTSIEYPTNAITVGMSGVRDIKIGSGNAGTGSPTSSNYAIDTLAPSFTMQYYSDSALSDTIVSSTYLKAGTYYIKISASETMGSTPTVTVVAEGTANDVTDGATTLISGNNYKYVRTITDDAAAIGSVLENISVSGTDAAGNTVTNINPTNEADKEIYTDTVAPAVSAGSDAGTVSASFTQNATVTDTDGSGIYSYLWSKVSGYYTVTFGSTTTEDTTVRVPGGGPYTIRLTATDVAGNSAYDDTTFTWGSLPGVSASAPSGVGSGSVDRTVGMSQTGDIGNVTTAGVNYLSYINSNAGFSTLVSRSNQLENHRITIKNLDLIANTVQFTIESTPQTLTLKVGETTQVDLDGDQIKDVEVKFTNIWSNRAELTIKSLVTAKEITNTATTLSSASAGSIGNSDSEIVLSSIPESVLQPGSALKYKYAYPNTTSKTVTLKFSRQLLNSAGKVLKTVTVSRSVKKGVNYTATVNDVLPTNLKSDTYTVRVRVLNSKGKVLDENSFGIEVKKKYFVIDKTIMPADTDIAFDPAIFAKVKSGVALPTTFKIKYAYTNNTDKAHKVRMVRELIDENDKVVQSSVGKWTMTVGEKDSNSFSQTLKNTFAPGAYTIRLQARDMTTDEVLAENSLWFTVELK